MPETQKRKLSEENDAELIEIYASIGDVRVELKDDIDYIDYKLEEFMKSMVIELKKLRRAIDKMNEKMEGMWRYSLNSFRINSAKADPQYDFDDWMLHVPGSPPTIWSDEE